MVEKETNVKIELFEMSSRVDTTDGKTSDMLPEVSQSILEQTKKRERSETNQLGINYSTAMNRLRVKIMYYLAYKCNMLDCYRCGKYIESSEQLSVEHKKPWLYNDTSLFWDLENIAFSHKLCNTGNKRYFKLKPKNKKDKGPIGTVWCGSCKKYLEYINFCKDASSWTGFSHTCRKCDKIKKDKKRKNV